MSSYCHIYLYYSSELTPPIKAACLLKASNDSASNHVLAVTFKSIYYVIVVDWFAYKEKFSKCHFPCGAKQSNLTLSLTGPIYNNYTRFSNKHDASFSVFVLI